MITAFLHVVVDVVNTCISATILTQLYDLGCLDRLSNLNEWFALVRTFGPSSRIPVPYLGSGYINLYHPIFLSILIFSDCFLLPTLGHPQSFHPNLFSPSVYRWIFEERNQLIWQE